MNTKHILVPALFGLSLALSGCAELGYGSPGSGHHTMGGGHQMGEMGEGHHERMQQMHQGQGMGMGHGMGQGHGMGMGEMSEEHQAHMQAMREAAAIEAAAVLQAYSDAINAEDVEAMAAQVVADERFSVIEGRGTNVGWADYRDHHIGPEFASERIDFHVYGYHDIDVRVGHMFAYATFTYAFEATLDGEPYNKEGRGTAVLMRTPEGWRIRHIQTS